MSTHRVGPSPNVVILRLKGFRGSAIERWFRLGVACSALICLFGCTTSSDAIIDEFNHAACLPVVTSPLQAAPPRAWKSEVVCNGRLHVEVSGISVGNVTAYYPSLGKTFVAAQPGDYIYPEDVRLEADSCFLYVKARGSAAGIWEQTWLFKFDLQKHVLLERKKVKDESMAPDCPASTPI